MTDERLRHLCRLASITADLFRSQEHVDEMVEIYGREGRDIAQCHRILADAFVELARRQEMRPRFRVAANRQEGG